MKQLLLTEYLSDGISKRELYQVVVQFVDAMIETERSDRQVVLKLDELFIKDGEVELKYEEAMKPLSILRITEFIKDVIFRSVFRVGEEVEDLADFLRFLDNEREVTLPYIYEYVMDELDLDIPSNRELPRGDETGVLDISFFEQNKVLREADKIQRHSQKLVQSMKQPQMESMAMQGDETGVLDPSFWERKMHNGPVREQAGRVVAKNISLINEKSKEEIRITKNAFVVGKDASCCDLVIANKTISRKHAQILVKGSRYYVMDLGSTNKTYLGNTELAPNTEVEIFDGSKIKFSNEVYEVVIV